MIVTIKKFASEFKKFALKANFVDMVVGIIIGMKFNLVLNSLVKDVILPPFAMFSSFSDLADMAWVIRPEIKNGDEVIKEAVAIHYGKFVELGVDFLIVALVMYFVVKGYNLYKSRKEDPDDDREETPQNIKLLQSIDKSLRQLTQDEKN